MSPGTVTPHESAMSCGNTTFRGNAMPGKSISVKESSKLQIWRGPCMKKEMIMQHCIKNMYAYTLYVYTYIFS